MVRTNLPNLAAGQAHPAARRRVARLPNLASAGGLSRVVGPHVRAFPTVRQIETTSGHWGILVSIASHRSSMAARARLRARSMTCGTSTASCDLDPRCDLGPRCSRARTSARPVQPRPVQPRPVQPRTVQPRPAQPRPVQPRPVQRCRPARMGALSFRHAWREPPRSTVISYAPLSPQASGPHTHDTVHAPPHGVPHVHASIALMDPRVAGCCRLRALLAG